MCPPWGGIVREEEEEELGVRVKGSGGRYRVRQGG
jgi:hypothetical protein